MKFKKFMAIVVSLLLLCTFAFGMSGCNGAGDGAKEGELTIRYFLGGYGDQWMKNAKAKFEASHEGVKVVLDGRSDVTDIMRSQVNSGKNLADIYWLAEMEEWREYVALGKITSLKDVYEAEVNTSEGKIKIKDYLMPNVCQSRYLSRVPGVPEEPWTMSLAFMQTGIVYNEEMLLSTKHTTAKAGEWSVGDTWTAPPETVTDLISYCDDLTAVGITPFAFAGKESDWLLRFMFGWWGQYQGANTLNTANPDVTANEGTFFDYWNYNSPEVFKQAGIGAAIDAFQSIFKGEDGQPKNAAKGVLSYTTQDAERNFASQNVAMVFCGAFIYNEIKDMLDADGDGEADFTMRMMSLPYVNGAQLGPDGEPLKMNYYFSEDAFFIPTGATNTQLAKEFLIMLCEEESLLDFTKETGELRPFQYDAQIAEKDGFEYSAFTKDVINIYNTTDVRLMRFPSGHDDVSDMYKYLQPLWTDAYSRLISELFTSDASTLLTNIYEGAKEEWSRWEAQIF